MWRRRQRRFSTHKRSGLTLLELLLVLALLVIIAALSMPAMTRPMENSRLRKSADLVRAELTSARVRAMRSGRIQVFQYSLGSGDYLLEPYFSDDDMLEASSAAGSVQLGQNNDPDTVIDTGKLPEGIMFFAGQASVDARGAEVQQQAMASTSVDATTAGQPILFYPDGSSSDATIILVNEQQKFVQITLRALTGIAQVSDLLTADQLGT